MPSFRLSILYSFRVLAIIFLYYFFTYNDYTRAPWFGCCMRTLAIVSSGINSNSRLQANFAQKRMPNSHFVRSPFSRRKAVYTLELMISTTRMTQVGQSTTTSEQLMSPLRKPGQGINKKKYEK